VPDLRLTPAAPASRPAPRTVELGRFRKVAFLGGIYSNHLALQQALRMARDARVDTVVALGDFGAFGPHPDRTVEILRDAGVSAIQGNYEESLAGGATDCHCGYTDPRDNHYAQISYDYTQRNTAAEHKEWMGTLPGHARLQIGDRRVLLCHGSPRRINEFLWETTTSEPFLRKLLRDFDADLIVCTHTGLPWRRVLEDGRGIVNAGALGRPANDGRANVWFAVVEEDDGGVAAHHVPVHYAHRQLAAEMRDEGLPEEFVETILTGWWTTCLEILPAKERARGRF
jgi:predicted phosphodiesterase